ncbi:MAG: protein translocase subunit SecF [Patescibacteria group bacterium]
MKLKIIQNRKYYYIFSIVLFVISVFSLIAWGLKPGLDFTGGSLLDVSFEPSRPNVQEIRSAMQPLALGDLVIQPASDKDMILRFKTVDEPTHQKILATLNSKFSSTTTNATVKEQRFESVGPVIGKELEKKAWIAILLASLAIILYVAYAFRKVSRPVASWKFGVSAIIALIHDITIVAGLFSILGHFAGIEIDSLFITALLTILGFSVHDTIVVFDRTRENLSKHYSGSFEEVVNDSVNQTITRSINTSLTVLLVLLTLYLLGGASIKNFVLALLFGIAIGTYSSIFVASPVIVDWNIFSKRIKAK